MMRPRDPRIRQRINQISHNLESANESAQEGLYAFSQNYVSPCLASVASCVSVCTAPCITNRDDRLRRRRQGHAEANFDFYDDWDNTGEEEDTLIGWGTGELDRLLAGSGLARSTDQPRRPRSMSYGTTHHTRRRNTVHKPDDRSDPTVIPSSSFIGFLERFPWRFGAKGIKYRPSAADLQEHPGSARRFTHEDEPLMEDNEEDRDQISYSDNRRKRSGTESSRGTSNSLSSRGDLFPSDEEDAVPLDDEFALTFARRGTGIESDDQASKSEVVISASSTSSLQDVSSRKSNRKKKKKKQRQNSSTKSSIVTDHQAMQGANESSISALKKEEEQASYDEESAITLKRVAAQEMAAMRCLGSAKPHTLPSPSDSREETTGVDPNQSPPLNIEH